MDSMSDQEDEDLFKRFCNDPTRPVVSPPPPSKRGSRYRFVKVPLWWIEAAARAAHDPAALVLMELLHASWRARSPAFRLANVRLAELGVSRNVKRRVLRDLEQAGLIKVERSPRKSPFVILLGEV